MMFKSEKNQDEAQLQAEAETVTFSPEERQRLEKKLLRKVDLRMSYLIIIYILNYIDRNNVPAARTNGLVRDLKLTGSEYPTLLSLLYVGYILFQIPSNIIVQKTGRPSIYLPVCIVIWGLISLLFYKTTNFTGAVVARFFLGIVEAAFFPGALFLLSKWYTKKELALRTAILYCGSLISNAFGGLIAAGVISMGDGRSNLGIANWRWLFIIEGAITIFCGLLAVFILPDFPHNSRGFTADERKLAVLRMTEDAGESDEDMTTTSKALIGTVTDPKVWLMALTLTAMVIGLSFNQFFPTLTAALGSFGRIQSLLLTAPPFAFATIVAFANARMSDKTGKRLVFIIWPLLMGIIGFIIALATRNVGARYFSLFLMAGSYGSFVIFLSWISNSFPRPPLKRACAIAFVNAFSQLGNVSGSYIYPSRWGPSYHYSFGISIAMFGVAIAGSLLHAWNLRRLNVKIERLEQEKATLHNDGDGALHGVKANTIPRELDVVPGFRYVI